MRLSAPEMILARDAVELVLQRHPYPAVAVDRRWDLVSANDPALALVDRVDPRLLGPPLNVYRLSLAAADQALRSAAAQAVGSSSTSGISRDVFVW